MRIGKLEIVRGNRKSDPRPRGVVTAEAGGKVHCKHCGCKVRSGLGNVCSAPACQRLAVA